MSSSIQAFAPVRAALAAGAVLAASSAFTQTSINLTQDATVRQTATYTYYARGDAAGSTITPFTTMFYPGGALHTFSPSGATIGLDGSRADNGTNGAPIAFAAGELTDNSNASEVRGWLNVEQVSYGTHSTNPHGGVFDIVFDLGSAYVITSVVVTYADAAGWRFSRTQNGQQVFTSMDAPSSVGDAGLSLFGTATVSATTALDTMSFSASAMTNAQYVVFRPEMQLSPNLGGNSYGGYIYELSIHGYAIPEPASAAVLAGVVALGGVMLRRNRRATPTN
jgi:hypothetical protein